MTIKFQTILFLFSLFKKCLKLTTFFLLFSLPFVTFAQKNGFEFSAETGILSDYRLKSGYDPFRPWIYKPYVVGDNYIDYFSDFSFKFKNSTIDLKARFGFSKDVTTTLLVRKGLETLKINAKDTESDKLSSSHFFSSFFIEHKPLSFFSYYFEFDFDIKNDAAFLPRYIDYQRHLASEKVSKIQLRVGTYFFTKVGDFGFRLPFRVEKFSVKGVTSNNFSLGQRPLLSYDLIFRSPMIFGELLRGHVIFSFDETRHNLSFYNSREISLNGKLEVLFGKTFHVEACPSWGIKRHSYDRSHENKLLVRFNLLLGRVQKISLLYQVHQSRFEKEMELSFVRRHLSLSYALRLGYTI